ncbi:MAG: cytidine deaminase [Mycobacteriales bacterium]
MPDPDAEDSKLITLARSARQRAHVPHTGVAEGAAVRDSDGRTYAGATVENADPALTTSALRTAIAAAASSGARSFEAAVVVGGSLVSQADIEVLREFGVGVPLLLAADDGAVHHRLST